MPVLTAGIVAAVASPVVAWLPRRRRAARGRRRAGAARARRDRGGRDARDPRRGITERGSRPQLSTCTGRQDKIAGWLQGPGSRSEQGATQAKQDAQLGALSTVVPALLGGRRATASRSSPRSPSSSSLTALSLFFLLKDGPTIRAWAERHLGRPAAGGAHDHPARAAVAARLLPRRHDRRRVQRGRGRARAR